MPKVKKPPKGAYYFYVTEKKLEHERRGYRMNLERAFKEFGPSWTQMSKEDKVPYEEMAKKAKEQDKYDITNKFTTTGESYAMVHQKMMDQRSEEDQMKDFIKHLTYGDGADSRMYMFIKTIYSVEEFDKIRKYWPSELSIAAFNLTGGLHRIHTTLVDTKISPPGYASFAKDNCEEAGLPMPGSDVFTDESRDYGFILKKIFGFANHWLKAGYDDSGHKHVMFTTKSEKEYVRGCIQWMVDQLKGASREKYQRCVDRMKIYDVSYLILCMAEEAKRINPAYDNYLVNYKLDSIAEHIIEKGNFEYREEITCPYHRTDAGSARLNYCAQNIVMRRIYMLFEEFIPAYKIDKTFRHDIAKIGKNFSRPLIKKKRELSVEKEVVVETPSWMSVPDRSSSSRNKSPNYAPEYTDMHETSDNLPWGKKPVQTPAFMHDDFPPMGNTWTGVGGRGSHRISAPQPSPMNYAGVGRGEKARPKPVDDDDDDPFPPLGASSNVGRGRGRGRGW